MKRTLLTLTLASLLSSFACSGGANEPAPGNPDQADQTCSPTDVDALQTSADAVEALTNLLDSNCEGNIKEDIVRIMAFTQAEGITEPVLAEAVRRGAPAEFSEEKKERLVKQLIDKVDAQLCLQGKSPGCEDNVYQSWEDLAKEHLALVRDTEFRAAGPELKSRLAQEDFIKELAELANAKFVEGNSIDPLIDGPASFAVRDRLIENAEHTIEIMSWGFLDDETGHQTAEKLIAKHNAGVIVRVIVDGQQSVLSGYDGVAALEEAGVEVVRWRRNDPARRYDGMHRKVMVVDGVDMIAGGLNFGNVYAHRGPEGTPRWRDTDVHVRGPAVGQANKLFAEVWNQQVLEHSLAHSIIRNPLPAPESAGNARVAVVDHIANDDANIYLATLKAFEGATESIDIENAYVISTPGLQDALLAAVRRGVRVRILTNSDTSVDEPIVSTPIINSMPAFVDAGAEVYLKQGTTLHSKFFIVDGLLTAVGSYNFHPRSYRMESENVVLALDEELAQNLGATFDEDVAAATRVTSGESIAVPRSLMTVVVNEFFFDQL